MHIQLTYRTFFKVEEYMKERRIDSYSRAIDELVNMAIILNEHKDTITDHELLGELKGQYKEGGLVDYIEKLNPSDFKIIHSIVQTEYMSRTKSKV